MDFGEIGWCGEDWTGLAQDRDQWMAPINEVMDLWVPSKVGKFLSDCTTGDLSSSAQAHS
jgi:hypothetical protein